MADDNSLASDLASAYDAVVKKEESGTAPAATATAQSQPAENRPSEDQPREDQPREDQPREDQPRDEAGRFAPKSIAPAAPADALEKAAAQDEAAAAPAPAEVKLEPKYKYPSSWKKDHADKWESLPEEIRAEVTRREEDFHKGLHEIKDTADFGRRLREVITPYLPTINALGASPEQAVQYLLNADHVLRHAQPAEKAAYMRNIAQQYGIDVAALAAQEPQIDPQMAALRAQLAQVAAQQQQFASAAKQQEFAAVQSEIDRFAAQPGHELLGEVREDMAALLAAGRAQDLQQAYEMATWARPDIRAQQLAKQQQETEKRIREQAAAQAAAAAKAAFDVTGQGAVGVAATTPGDLRSELAAAFSSYE